jgi:hypothetical protein
LGKEKEPLAGPDARWEKKIPAWRGQAGVLDGKYGVEKRKMAAICQIYGFGMVVALDAPQR